MAGTITVRPGEIITVVGMPEDPNAPRPSHPIMLPGMPGWGTAPGARPSHPIALPGDPWWGGGGSVDPGYSPPWAQVPVDPGYGVPIEPPIEPPPTQPPVDSGNWTWAWSPQLGRWVWVKVPGEGEAGPKTTP